ncbi:hypothetical protein [Argonema antarcticum]|uniref:hypothetical protein n=1 Tax=Argonema antarcticum TaxID=2942763 RepID=UPI002013640C|nr:hypothetical protein [Argonema antarcticum]MCL1475925.1 hypothetical protein [Argonema antarcticum A004/B2]
MRLPASPNFIKFFKILSKEEKSLFLEKIHTFFRNIEGEYPEILKLRGSLYHPSLKSIKPHHFIIDRSNRSEYWEIAFYDTAIPHARIAILDCNPPPSKYYSLDMNYTQLLLNHSLADIADGFDYTSKPLIQRLLRFHPENWVATAGETVWVYLMLKLQALPKLYNQFSVELEPKLPFWEFGNYLITEVGFGHQEVIQVSMNKKCFRSFLQQNDTLILNALGQKQIAEWLSRLDIEFDTWFSAISYRPKFDRSDL